MIIVRPIPRKGWFWFLKPQMYEVIYSRIDLHEMVLAGIVAFEAYVEGDDLGGTITIKAERIV